MRQHRSFGLLRGAFCGCKSALSFTGLPNRICKPLTCQTLAPNPNLLWDWALGSGGFLFLNSGGWGLDPGFWGLVWTLEVWALPLGSRLWGLGFGVWVWGLGPGLWGLGFGGSGLWTFGFGFWSLEV